MPKLTTKKINFYLNSRINFGAFLILLLEINFLVNKFNFKNIFFVFSIKNFDQKTFNEYMIIFNNLNLGYKNIFTYTDNIKINHHKFYNYEKLFVKKRVYSFESINLFYLLSNQKPYLYFKNKIINDVHKYLSFKKIRKFITLHLKHDLSHKLAHTKYKIWQNVLNRITLKKNFHIIFVGNDSIEKNMFLKNQKLVFCNFELSILHQIYLVALSNHFIGTASGFCCSANFSDTPYTIIKHPDHHKSLMDIELVSQKLPFSNKNSKFVFMKQTFQNILLILKDFIIG